MQAKKNGWSIPLERGATVKYTDAMKDLYRFYDHANKELYRLMESLGPASGWRGEFPTEHSPLSRKADYI
jgi:hypothetical protein